MPIRYQIGNGSASAVVTGLEDYRGRQGPKIAGMVTRIGKKKPPRLYIDEWIAAKELDHTKVGQRMEPPVSRTTVWRWVNEPWRLNPEKMAALADAIGLESPTMLWYSPDRPSADALLARATDDVHRTVIDIVERLTRRAS